MKLKLEELTSTAFSLFGQVIEPPRRPCDANGPGWQWWGENLALAGGRRSYAIGYLDLQPWNLRFDWAERHLKTDELVIPVGGDCIIYTAPPLNLDEPGVLPPMRSFRAFRICLGQAVLFGKGVWHGAPLAIDRPTSAIVLLQKGTGHGDAYIARFASRPVEIEL